MKNERVVKINQAISDYIASVSGTEVVIPFYLIEQAITATKKNSNLDIHEISATDVHFYKIINGVESLLLTIGYEYESPKNEDGTVDLYQVYEDFYEIYNGWDFKSLWLYEDLLKEEVELITRERLQLGLFENRIISLLEKGLAQVEKISDVATDKKKLGGLIKEFRKQVPELSGLLKEVKDNKVEK